MNQALFYPEDLFEIKGRGIVVTGRLVSGTLTKGMQAEINGKNVLVEGIEKFRKPMDTLTITNNEEQYIGILLKNIKKHDFDQYRQVPPPSPITFHTLTFT